MWRWYSEVPETGGLAAVAAVATAVVAVIVFTMLFVYFRKKTLWTFPMT